MYIVVIGLGEVGRHLLSVLDKEGHDVVAVDSNKASVDYAEEHFDVATLLGYGGARRSSSAPVCAARISLSRFQTTTKSI
ncbi:MAG: NAD-binding protein [Polyangiales bacterium]